MTTDTTVADSALWGFPDSEICTAAHRLVDDVSPEFLTNHCIRSYLFARELAAAQGLRAGADYDEELVFLACLLHDLGITEFGGGSQRFEVDGADAAVRFLREQHVPEDRLTPVWQAIALHTSVGLAHRFGAEQSVVHFGITLDINGFGAEQLPTGFAERVHEAWPRHDLGYAITDLIAQGTATDPAKAPPFSFPAHVHELINGGRLTFLDMVAASPWGDQRR